MSSFIRDKVVRSLPAVIHDLLMVLAAWLGFYGLRFNLDSIPEHFIQYAYEAAPVVLMVQGIALYLFMMR